MTVSLWGMTRRGKEIDGHTRELCLCFIKNKYLHLSFPPPSFIMFLVYVGLIDAFRHRIKACGNVPLRSCLEAMCLNTKKKLKQSSSKEASSRLGASRKHTGFFICFFAAKRILISSSKQKINKKCHLITLHTGRAKCRVLFLPLSGCLCMNKLLHRSLQNFHRGR